jgi:hypothetical protein
MSTKVVNIRRDKFDVYVGRGRGSRWGNPFTFKEGTLAEFCVPKDEVLPRYEAWLKQQPELMESLHELRGKVLGCFCRPAKGFQGKVMCHAQILAAMVDGCRPEDIE